MKFKWKAYLEIAVSFFLSAFLSYSLPGVDLSRSARLAGIRTKCPQEKEKKIFPNCPNCWRKMRVKREGNINREIKVGKNVSWWERECESHM